MGECTANAHSSLFLECNEYGLLTENQLLKFYQNELHESVEEFVDEFLKVRGISIPFQTYVCICSLSYYIFV